MATVFESQYDERKFFRLRYPPTHRPRLRAYGWAFPVVETSEQGLVFYCDWTTLAVGQTFSGVVAFHDGDEITVEGKVLRMFAGEVVLKLMRGIPFRRMILEQRYVISLPARSSV